MMFTYKRLPGDDSTFSNPNSMVIARPVMNSLQQNPIWWSERLVLCRELIIMDYFFLGKNYCNPYKAKKHKQSTHK